MATDRTPAEPSDEALIEALTQAAANYVACTIAENEIDMDRAEAALRARLASNAEALAKARETVDALQQAGELVTRRAEAAEGRIAELAQDRQILDDLNTGLQDRAEAAEAALAECRAAMDERDLFSNPDILDKAASEIDCDGSCEHIYRESDTNFSMCTHAEKGEYCPNDIAETLRAMAKLSRALAKEAPRHE
jgi:hypothetical protein